MRWVQKIDESGEPTGHTSYVVLDAEVRGLEVALVGVSEEDAAMVATGQWRYVYEDARA